MPDAAAAPELVQSRFRRQRLRGDDHVFCRVTLLLAFVGVRRKGARQQHDARRKRAPFAFENAHR